MKSPKRDATSVSRVSTWASPHTARRSAIRLLCTVAVLAVLLPGHGLVAQTAVELLDKAMKLQIAQTSFCGTASSRQINVKLVRQQGQAINESLYDIGMQLYRHVDVHTRPPDDWAVKMDYHANPGSLDFTDTAYRQILIKLNGTARYGTVDDQGHNLVLNDSPPQTTYLESLHSLLIGSFSNTQITEDIIYRYLLPDAGGLGNRSWGLQQAVIKRVETSPDGTKVYCIAARLFDERPVLVWINGSDFRVTRVIRLPEKRLEDGTPEPVGFITTSISFTETVYTYAQTPFPTDDDLAEFQKPAIDFGLPASRARFLDITDVVGLFSDRWQLPKPSPDSPPESDADKAWGKNINRGIVIVETDKNFVSGFMTRIKGTDFVVTNLRALAEEDVQPMKSADLYEYYRSCLYWEDNILDQLEYRAAIIRALKSYEETPALFAAQLSKN